MGTPSTTKYLVNSDGVVAEQTALVTSTGVSDAQQIPALNASGVLDPSLFPADIASAAATVTAYEVLAAGDFVNVFNNAAVASARKANATAVGMHAMGFVKLPYNIGENALVYFEGINEFVSGQIPGDVYLSTTPGQATSTPPSSSGNVVQCIGFATSATSINFQASRPITLA